MTDKSDLIGQLNAAFSGNKEGPGESRLRVSTNTLMADGSSASKDVTLGELKPAPQIPVEQDVFRNIITGHRKYYITTEKIKLLEEVRFLETQNLVPTGRSRLITITSITEGAPDGPVREGYTVIGWI